MWDALHDNNQTRGILAKKKKTTYSENWKMLHDPLLEWKLFFQLYEQFSTKNARHRST